MRKILAVAAVLFLLYYVSHNPVAAAGTGRHLMGLLGDAADGAITFVSALSGGAR